MDPETTLHGVISRLRSLVGADLSTTPSGYGMGKVSLDTAAYEEHVDTARRSGAIEDWEAASERWGGEPFRGYDMPSIRLEVERLRQLRRHEQMERLGLLVDQGKAGPAADELELIVEADQFNEEAVGLYMRALYRSGRKPAALRAFARYADRLAEETGLEPSPRLRELELAILVDHFDSPPSLSRPPTSLPLQIGYVDLEGGRRVAVGRTGSGPTIVVHPGWMSKLDLIATGLDMRAPFWAALAKENELILFDRHNTGLSRSDGNALGFEESVTELIEVIGATARLPTPVLAASGAGPLAIQAAVDEPGLISHLLLFATFSSGPATFPSRVADSMVELVRASWRMGSDVLSYLLFPSASSEDQSAMAGWQREMAEPEVAADLLRSFYDADVSDQLARIDVPCLVLHYRGDKAIPIRGGEDLARGIRNSRYVPLDGMSHYPLPGEEAEVAGLIGAFLEGTGV